MSTGHEDDTGPIAVVGLGAIGAGVARNLLRSGFSVRGCDRSEVASRALAEAGVQIAATPFEAARGCDVLMVCVFDAAQAEQVLLGPDGASKALSPGASVVLHTTTSPAAVRSLAARVEVAGLRLVDAPVTGGKAGADSGTLTIICSGPEDAVRGLEPVFAATGSTTYVAGTEPGQATSVKLVNQLLTGVHLAAAAEAVAFAVQAGVDPDLAYEVVSHGTGNSAAFSSRAKAMLADDLEPRGMVEIFTKDLAIVTALAARVDAATPLAEAALERFEIARRRGYGRHDSAAVIKSYRSG